MTVAKALELAGGKIACELSAYVSDHGPVSTDHQLSLTRLSGYQQILAEVISC